MKVRIALAIVVSLLVRTVSAETPDASRLSTKQTFAPDWDSLDSRPTPNWWIDAKFGIFIHWGVYSVPAFSKVGQYSEWYWQNLRNPSRPGHAETKRFHNKNYGPDFTYADFVPRFRCELFNPEDWASLFAASGAKYVVLTSKHHDGYTLWPSEQAERSWGRPWSSTSCGPRRDLLGDLTDAVRKTDVKMGIYYSLYEWYNPLYIADPDLYVREHMVPQFKDLVTQYAPEVVFSDGEWDHPAEVWKSPDLLAWLFNDAPCNASVVINDRWGKSLRHKHGGYFTTEYGAGLPNGAHPWEENRGMAHSFGYSRTEQLADYKPSNELVYMLIDIVSRGGNFLLDIGPTADGRIPVIMQQRLKDIGDWLEVNGEAIYGTRPWQRTCQWTVGERPAETHGMHRANYDVLKLTVAPDEGMATKECFFTNKADTLYCICPVFPDGVLVVQDVTASAQTRVTLLGVDTELEWKQVGSNLEIAVPSLNPSRMPCQHAFTFKISELPVSQLARSGS